MAAVVIVEAFREDSVQHAWQVVYIRLSRRYGSVFVAERFGSEDAETGAVAPAAKPVASVHVTVGLDVVPAHIQPAPTADMKLSPAGKVSTTVTDPAAADGPWLVTVTTKPPAPPRNLDAFPAERSRRSHQSAPACRSSKPRQSPRKPHPTPPP